MGRLSVGPPSISVHLAGRVECGPRAGQTRKLYRLTSRLAASVDPSSHLSIWSSSQGPGSELDLPPAPQHQWAAQGRLEFTRSTFRGHCEKESLIGEAGEGRPKVYGVKSFEHATDRLEDRCTKVLDLVPNFADRQIRPEADWRGDLYPALTTFLLDAAKAGERLRLVLDAHLTLSFAAGSVLNIKSGRTIELEQRTLGKRIWSPDDLPSDPAWSQWTFQRDELNSSGADIVVAVSLTHDVASAVGAYVRGTLPAASQFLSARLSTGPGARSVVCGRHAFDLAEALTAEIKAMRDELPGGRVHLFMAAPGAFSFSLGQRQTAMGSLTLYEYDFEGEHGGSYQPSLSLPAKG